MNVASNLYHKQTYRAIMKIVDMPCPTIVIKLQSVKTYSKPQQNYCTILTEEWQLKMRITERRGMDIEKWSGV